MVFDGRLSGFILIGRGLGTCFLFIVESEGGDLAFLLRLGVYGGGGIGSSVMPSSLRSSAAHSKTLCWIYGYLLFVHLIATVQALAKSSFWRDERIFLRFVVVP